MRSLLPLVLLAWCAALCAAQAQYPRPRRPERLHTADQISNYLKELQEYYSVHGRGRYGKRQMQPAGAARLAGPAGAARALLQRLAYE